MRERDRERECTVVFLLLQAVVVASCKPGGSFYFISFCFGYFLFESPKFFLLRTRGRMRAGGSRKENKERDPCYVKKPWHILLFDPLGTLFLPT